MATEKRLVEKKFTRIELINAIERFHNRKVKFLKLYYPSDFRCQYRLWVELGFTDQPDFMCTTNYANEDDSVLFAFNYKVEPVSWTWRQYGDIVLEGVFRVDCDVNL